MATVSLQLQSVFSPSVQPYMVSWLAYDSQEEVVALEIPVLIIGGTADSQVSESDAENLHMVSEEGENKAVYSNPDLPLSDGLIEGILRFME